MLVMISDSKLPRTEIPAHAAISDCFVDRYYLKITAFSFALSKDWFLKHHL